MCEGSEKSRLPARGTSNLVKRTLHRMLGRLREDGDLGILVRARLDVFIISPVSSTVGTSGVEEMKK
jgi:hypothetical protein